MRTIEGRDEGGDGTVPRLSAIPYGVTPDDAIVRYIKDKHGALPANAPVLIELEGVLTARDVIARDTSYDVGVVIDDIWIAGETIEATIEAESDLVIDAVLCSPDGAVVSSKIATDRRDNTYSTGFDDVAPGSYALRVGVRGAGGVVTNPLVVLPPVDPAGRVMSNLVLTGTVLTVDGDRRIEPSGAVYIHDGRIEAVQPVSSAPPCGLPGVAPCPHGRAHHARPHRPAQPSRLQHAAALART